MSTARHGTSDIVPVKTSENGLMHTGRSLESGDRILIGIRRMWHRSTARNMPLITAGRKRGTPDRRSAAGQLYGIITTTGNAQKPQNRRRSDRSSPVQARIPMRQVSGARHREELLMSTGHGHQRTGGRHWHSPYSDGLFVFAGSEAPRPVGANRGANT